MSLRHESDPDDDGVVDINFDIAMAPMSSASVSPVNSARTGQEDDESSRPILGPHDHDDEHEGGDADVDAEDPVSIQSYRPKLSFVNGLAIVVGLQIGSGIFSAPVQVSNHVSSPGEGVLVWFLAGLLVWTGASSFIELGIAIPENGGVQEYLRFCYGDLAGFIFTWTWVGIAKPAAMGIISIVFADYLCSSISPSAEPSPFVIKAVGLLGLGSITFVNCLGIKTGATAANGFLALKLFAVYSIIIFGAILLINKNAEGVGSPKHGWWDNQSPDAIGSVWSRLGRFVTAIYGALFCYGGWETIGFVAGELEKPTRDLPRIINTAMLIVLVGFCLMNSALYIAIPMVDMRTSSTPAVTIAKAVLGKVGGWLYSLIIATSAMGALNANVFATGRLCAAASKRGYFPAVLANLHLDSQGQETKYHQRVLQWCPGFVRHPMERFAQRTADLRLHKEVPIYAMIMNGLLASFYIVIGSFGSLVTFVGVSEYFFFLFAVAGLPIVRRNATYQYRTLVINPVVFCFLSSFLVLRGLVADPIQGLAIMVVLLLGTFVFWRTRIA